MREIELGRYRKARVWLGELPLGQIGVHDRLSQLLSAELSVRKELKVGALCMG